MCVCCACGNSAKRQCNPAGCICYWPSRVRWLDGILLHDGIWIKGGDHLSANVPSRLSMLFRGALILFLLTQLMAKLVNWFLHQIDRGVNQWKCVRRMFLVCCIQVWRLITICSSLLSMHSLNRKEKVFPSGYWYQLDILELFRFCLIILRKLLCQYFKETKQLAIEKSPSL